MCREEQGPMCHVGHNQGSDKGRRDNENLRLHPGVQPTWGFESREVFVRGSRKKGRKEEIFHLKGGSAPYI
jgi:hypothetical protein